MEDDENPFESFEISEPTAEMDEREKQRDRNTHLLLLAWKEKLAAERKKREERKDP